MARRENSALAEPMAGDSDGAGLTFSRGSGASAVNSQTNTKTKCMRISPGRAG
jgi:hypothetical protein